MTKNTNLENELETNGYLSLNKFIDYLKEYHPEASLSYPAMTRAVERGDLRTVKFASQHRVMISEAKRWIAEGNYSNTLAKTTAQTKLI